jgi:hypothetical protein
MNTVQAEQTFAKVLKKHSDPKAEIVCTGNAHDVRQFKAEISGGVTDAQIDEWISEQAVEVALFELKVVDDFVAAYPGVERKAVKLVRRMPPNVKRTRNEHGEMCWRVSARVGTRVEPYPKADPRSARSRAIADAKRSEAEAEEREKSLSEILEAMP